MQFARDTGPQDAKIISSLSHPSPPHNAYSLSLSLYAFYSFDSFPRFTRFPHLTLFPHLNHFTRFTLFPHFTHFTFSSFYSLYSFSAFYSFYFLVLFFFSSIYSFYLLSSLSWLPRFLAYSLSLTLLTFLASLLYSLALLASSLPRFTHFPTHSLPRFTLSLASPVSACARARPPWTSGERNPKTILSRKGRGCWGDRMYTQQWIDTLIDRWLNRYIHRSIDRYIVKKISTHVDMRACVCVWRRKERNKTGDIFFESLYLLPFLIPFSFPIFQSFIFFFSFFTPPSRTDKIQEDESDCGMKAVFV